MPTPQTKADLQITQINITNFMKIKAVSVRVDPTTSLFTVGGENGNGKTSFINAIEAALTGPDRKATKPVHEGADGAFIAIDAPPYRIERRFDDRGKAALRVLRTDDGSEAPSPSNLLNELISSSFIDPSEFIHKQPAEQRKILMDIVKIDTYDLDNKITDVAERIKTINYQQTGLTAKVRDLPSHDDAPSTRPEIGELATRLTQAEHAKRDILDTERKAAETLNRCSDLARYVHELDDEITRLTNKRDAIQKEIKELNESGAASLDEGYPAKIKAADESITIIKSEIDGIGDLQRKFDDNAARAKAKGEWESVEQERSKLENNLVGLRADKKATLEAVTFPVEGLGFEEGGITLNGLPFYQASDAEKIYAATGVCLSNHGRLAPVLIRNGSMFDLKTIEKIGTLAASFGAQTFVETVSNKIVDSEGQTKYDRECTIEIEDGEIAQ